MYEQRVEAIELVLGYLVDRMDIVSLCVGRSPAGDQYGVRVDTMAEQLGLEQRRVERALRDIHAAGILSSKRRDEQIAPGEYRGLTAVRYFSRELFTVIGCAGLVEIARKKESQARRGLRTLRDTALTALRDKGRKFNESRPVARSLAEYTAGLFKPPAEPDPA